jgi:hypothetical protein
MPEFDPFDIDFDGDVDGIDFLGFDYLVRRVLRPDADKQENDEGEFSGGVEPWEDEEAPQEHCR